MSKDLLSTNIYLTTLRSKEKNLETTSLTYKLLFLRYIFYICL